MDPGIDKRTARRIASKAHRGQVDLQGEPYIGHPLAVSRGVSKRLRKAAPDLVDLGEVMAILHDVVEDSELTLDDLADAGASNELLLGIEVLSRREGQPYSDYINYLVDAEYNHVVKFVALWVKLSDIEHNTQEDRRYEGDESMRKRYEKSWNRILDKLEEMENDGD